MTKKSKKVQQPNWRARVTLHTMFAEVEVNGDGGIMHKRVALADVAGTFSGVPVGTGLLPQDVLFVQHAAGKARVGVFVRPQRHRLLTIQQAYELPMPGFVFVGQGGTYELYAVKGAERPSLNAQLYYPPLPNIFEGGNICAGEMTFPTCTVSNIWEVWGMVATSYFTGHLTGGRCQSHKSILDLWHAMHLDAAYAAETAVFPDEELVPTKKVLRQVMRGDS